MFGVDSSELLLIILVAVVVIGPKDLPRVMRTVGKWVGKARGMANQFRTGVDQMVRDSEIAELEQKWREQNEAVMRAHPNAPPVSDWGVPTPPPTAPVLPDSQSEIVAPEVGAFGAPAAAAGNGLMTGPNPSVQSGRAPPGRPPELVRPAAPPTRMPAPGSDGP
jgi:sec-independent protein translocase protein TatB